MRPVGEVTDTYWSVAELIKRIRTHDFDQQEYEILMIAEALARDGRVCAIGRRVIDGETTRTEWEAIPRHEWEGLRFTLSPRGRPHPGDAFREHRLAWTDVKFSERDLRREWLDAVFSRPPAIYQGDIIIPARPVRATSRTPMFDDEVRRALKWRREKWRRLWIAKFAERQRAARRWIAVIDLVDWCVHSTTTASREAEAQAREVAYRRLTDSIWKGEFERGGRSKILYLDTLVTSDGASPRCRLTREQFEIAVDIAAAPPAPSSPITVLNCCWLPADLGRHWLRAHGYSLPPNLNPKAPQETGPSDPTLPTDEAIRRVGRGLYGGDWIGELTKRERWLIERYIDGIRKDRDSTILAGAISHVVGGRRWAEVPGDPALMAEADRARDRGDWMEAQREAVFDWFESRGFDLDSDGIDKARFETALVAPHTRGVGTKQPPNKASEINGQRAEPAGAVDAKATTHSGFPGRPGKAKHLIEDEFKRRTKSSEASPNLADEAAALLDWLVETHPTVPRPTKRTIENNIRDDHRRWRASHEAGTQ